MFYIFVNLSINFNGNFNNLIFYYQAKFIVHISDSAWLPKGASTFFWKGRQEQKKKRGALRAVLDRP